MPVVINEVEILEPSGSPSASGPPAPPTRGEPLPEQLRRLQRDLDGRQRRLAAD